MRNIFFFNIRRFMRHLVPEELQGVKNMSLFYTIAHMFLRLYIHFRVWLKSWLYELKRHGHVAHLEAVLNDTFDAVFRRIRIAPAPILYAELELYTDAELKPLALYTDAENEVLALYTEEEISVLGDDFVILIPLSINYDIHRLNALVEKYALPGMQYKIIIT